MSAITALITIAIIANLRAFREIALASSAIFRLFRSMLRDSFSRSWARFLAACSCAASLLRANCSANRHLRATVVVASNLFPYFFGVVGDFKLFWKGFVTHIGLFVTGWRKLPSNRRRCFREGMTTTLTRESTSWLSPILPHHRAVIPVSTSTRRYIQRYPSALNGRTPSL